MQAKQRDPLTYPQLIARIGLDLAGSIMDLCFINSRIEDAVENDDKEELVERDESWYWTMAEIRAYEHLLRLAYRGAPMREVAPGCQLDRLANAPENEPQEGIGKVSPTVGQMWAAMGGDEAIRQGKARNPGQQAQSSAPPDSESQGNGGKSI